MAEHSVGTVVLVSGGIDSTIAADLMPEARRVFIDYGQPYAVQEYETCRRLFSKLKVIGLEGRELDAREVYVPARNLMLATLALPFGSRIVMAGMADDVCADKNPHAFAEMSRVLSEQAGFAVSVESPFWAQTKYEAMARYIVRFGSEGRERLLSTFSCYHPVRDRPCLDCEACFRWAVAHAANGSIVASPSPRIIRTYLEKLHRYHPQRQWATLQALRRWGYRLVVCDIDGVLTVESDGIDYAMRTPREAAIDRLQQLMREREADGEVAILLHTARAESDRDVTQKWLRDYGVPYHALLMEKPPADLLFDDRAQP